MKPWSLSRANASLRSSSTCFKEELNKPDSKTGVRQSDKRGVHGGRVGRWRSANRHALYAAVAVPLQILHQSIPHRSTSLKGHRGMDGCCTGVLKHGCAACTSTQASKPAPLQATQRNALHASSRAGGCTAQPSAAAAHISSILGALSGLCSNQLLPPAHKSGCKYGRARQGSMGRAARHGILWDKA